MAAPIRNPGSPVVEGITRTTVHIRVIPHRLALFGQQYRVWYKNISTNQNAENKDLGVITHTNIFGLEQGHRYSFWIQAFGVADGWSPRVDIRMVAGAIVNDNGIWRPAVPYVNVGGLWKISEGWTRVMGEWTKTE